MKSEVIARNSFWYAIDVAFGLVFALVSSVAVARVMGPEKLGYYNYIVWIVSITGMLGGTGVGATTGKYMAEYVGRGDIRTAKAIAEVMLRVQMATAALVVTGGLAVVWLWVPAPHRTYASIAVVSLAPFLLMTVPSAALGAREDFRANVIPSLVGTASNFTGIVLSLGLGWDLPGLTASLLVSRVVDFAARYGFYRRRYAISEADASGWRERYLAAVPPERRRRMLRFCGQSMVLMLINAVVWNRSELFFLERFCDIRELTYYSLAFNIIEKISLMPQVFSTATGASLLVQYGRDAESVGRVTAQSLRYLALLTLPLSLGMGAVSSPFVSFLYGAQYVPAIVPLALQSVLGIPKALLVPAQFLLMAGERQGFIVKWGIVCSVVNIGLDLWWIPGGGAIGATFANGTAQFIAAAGQWFYAVRHFAVPVPGRSLVKFGLAAAAMALPVAMAAQWLPPVAALVGGVAGGAALYLILLRFTQSLDARDRTRLESLSGQLPERLRKAYLRALRVAVR